MALRMSRCVARQIAISHGQIWSAMLAAMQEHSSYERTEQRPKTRIGSRAAEPPSIRERLQRNQLGIMLAVVLTVAAATVLLLRLNG